MKRANRIIAVAIGIVVSISAVLVLISAISADRRSQRELEETDKFIAQYETKEFETYRVILNTVEEESTDDRRSSDPVDNSDSRSNDDFGTSDSSTDMVEETVSAEELAQIVLNQGINGDERKAYLGDRYDEVQRWIDENYQAPEPETYSYYYEGEEVYYQPDTGYYYSDDALTPDMGVNYYNGVMETYYNLPMEGVVDWMHSLGYGGDYWIRSDGVKMLGDYVMVAADYGWMPKGSIVETSLGTGIVCDTGLGGWYWYDIAVDW